MSLPLLTPERTRRCLRWRMPTRLCFRIGPPLPEAQQPGRRLHGALVALTLALSTAAQSGAPVTCGADVSPEAVAQRLNDVRHRGAGCPTGGWSTAPPLAWNERLVDAARVQAREMARLGRMSHRDSQDRGLGERLRAAGYRFNTAVENVAIGYPSVDDVVDAWLESEGHCENLMNASVREFGLACTDAASNGAPEERRYWALVLGAPAHSKALIPSVR